SAMTISTLYALILTVVVGHMSLEEVANARDTALSAAGRALLGPLGHFAIVLAALLAASSAINASFYSTGRMAYVVAKTGQLPRELKRRIRGEHGEGTLICAALALLTANFVPLESIATMGSAGFLILFLAVNLANVRLARETRSKAWLSALAALSTAFALVVLCVEVDENPATRNHLWILVGMIGAALAIEVVYRRVSGRSGRQRRRSSPGR
ncbi:MAG: amino acid permease, partial [Pseudomonadota bacterium]